jgi:hypothetical protein
MRPRAFALPAVAAIALVASLGAAAPTTPAWIVGLGPPSASASASASASTAASASSATRPPTDEVAAAAERRRARERREQQVEVVDLTPEQELDPQRFAVGGDAGLGWLTSKGSGAGQAALDFALTFAFGLGPGGARVPWTIEAFAAFALTGSTFRGGNASGAGNPDRFTELGARLVYRFPEGALQGSWLSAGAGIVFSSWGDPNGAHGDVSPGGLVDLGVGVHEWVSRRARLGIAFRVPVQLSAHPGIGGLGVFYAQIGIGK